jgi:hypothetical protein
VRSTEESLNYAQMQVTHPTQNWFGECLGFVRACYDIPGKYLDATSNYLATTIRGTGVPPAGTLQWWTGGSQGHGHVILMDGGELGYSTDFGDDKYHGDGKVRLIHRASVSKYVPSLVMREWSYDLEGVDIMPLTNDDKSFIENVARRVVLYLTTGEIDGDVIPNTPTYQNRKPYDLQSVKAAIVPAGTASVDNAAVAKAVLDAMAGRLQA